MLSDILKLPALGLLYLFIPNRNIHCKLFTLTRTILASPNTYKIYFFTVNLDITNVSCYFSATCGHKFVLVCK